MSDFPTHNSEILVILCQVLDYLALATFTADLVAKAWFALESVEMTNSDRK